MLTIENLSWGGCFSYGPSNEISLNSANITQLLGENGVGKSSIALIIQEALFNKNSKGVKKADIPNREGDGSYWIKLTFTDAGKQYLVDVVRKATLKVKLIEDGEDISSHTATETFKTIEEKLGMDFKTFVPLVYQSTTEGLFFLTATDTNRKKFLIDLFALDEYDKYHALFKELVSDTSKSVTKVEAQVDAIASWIKKNESLPSKKELSSVTAPKPLSIDTQELTELRFKAANIREINKKINNNNHYQEMLKKISFAEDLLSQSKVDTSSMSKEIGGISAEIKRLKTYISKMKTLSDKCPTCEQDIDKDILLNLIKASEKEVESLRARESEISLKIKEADALNILIDQNKSKKQEWESILVKIDSSLPKSTEDIDAINDRINEISERVNEIELEYKKQVKNYEAIIASNVEAEKHNSRIVLLQEQLEEHRVDMGKAKLKLDAVAKELTILEVLKKAFSTNGIVAYKLENLVKDLEEQTNEYLAELSDGRFTINFSISSDKLNVLLTDSGADIDVAALSSGELARVNVSTLLAIRKLMNSISKTQVNVLFLDEMVNVLDEYGKDKLVEVLLKEEKLNTFLVSHGWSHPLLSKVLVQKTNGISRLING